jgi:hypothetical protein
MGLTVAMGEACLGDILCEQGNVLYLALEDSERRLQKRIEKVLGPVAEWPRGFDYATEWPRANDGGLAAVRDWILSVENPRLIIVDVLAMFRPAGGGKDSMYEADYHAIKGLQALGSEYRVAIIVVHHTRKGGGDADPFEKVSGTLGLSGAADTTIVLGRGSTGATLYGRGRDIEEIESAVEFNKGDYRWFVLGKAEEIRRTDERAVILAALLEAGEAMSPADLAAATGMKSINLRQLLFKMVASGDVVRPKYGQYAHPCVIGPAAVTPDNSDNTGNASYLAARDGDDE